MNPSEVRFEKVIILEGEGHGPSVYVRLTCQLPALWQSSFHIPDEDCEV